MSNVSRKWLLAAAIFALTGPLIDPSKSPPTEKDLEAIKDHLEAGDRDAVEKLLSEKKIQLVNLPTDWPEGTAESIASTLKEQPERITKLLELLGQSSPPEKILQELGLSEPPKADKTIKEIPEGQVIATVVEQIASYGGEYTITDGEKPFVINHTPQLVPQTAQVELWKGRKTVRYWTLKEYNAWLASQA